jgi:hypothetical protein
MTNQDAFLDQIRKFIGEIVGESQFGTSLQKLHSSLNSKLGIQFEPNFYNCLNMYDFLLNYADDLVDIEIKKSMTFIYPKNRKFERFLNTNAQDFNHENIQKSHKNAFEIEHLDPPGLTLSRNRSCHLNQIGFSPILFYGDDDNDDNSIVRKEEKPKKTNFFNMEFGNDIPRADVSEIQSLEFSRFGNRFPGSEDSHLELKDNLKFIENILKENEGDTSAFTTFSDMKGDSPKEQESHNFNEISTTQLINKPKQKDIKSEWDNPIRSGNLKHSC